MTNRTGRYVKLIICFVLLVIFIETGFMDLDSAHRYFVMVMLVLIYLSMGERLE